MMINWLDIEAGPLEDVPGVSARGEVDAATAPALQEAIDGAVASSVGAFVIDLTPTTFLDSSGIVVLLHTGAVLGREDRSLVVICPQGAVREVLALCGLCDRLALFETAADAAAALVRPA